MKKVFFTTFITALITIQSYSQEKKLIYVDENYKEINFKKFKSKFKSEVFFVVVAETDSVIYKKLRFKEYFGKLDIKKKSQLNKLFFKRVDIDTTKIWLIHYLDSLPDIKFMPKKSKIILLDSLNKPVGERIIKKLYKKCTIVFSSKKTFGNKHLHAISYIDFKKNISYEINKIKKYQNVTLLHFYEENKGYPIENDKWLKDYNSILKKTFNDGMQTYRTIIIYPDGEFYASSMHKCNFNEKALINKKKFKKLKKQFIRNYSIYN